MNWNSVRQRLARRLTPAGSAQLPRVALAPAQTTVSAEEYQAALVAQALARDLRLPDAYARIGTAIAAVPDPEERKHLQTHAVRWLQTIAMLPDGHGDLVDIAAAPFYVDALQQIRGWNVVPVATLSIDYEKDRLPFDDDAFGAALLGEVIEHFVLDPLFCLNEINRVLKQGGALVVTTPNAASWFSIYEALHQRHPSRWPVYSGNPTKARNHIHAREYTCAELRILLEAAGFGECEITTLDYGIAPPYAPLAGFDPTNRGETIYAACRKAGPPTFRYVKPIYLETEAFAAACP